LTSDEHVHKSNHDSQTCDPGVLANVQPQSAAQTKDTPFCELCEMAVETKLWEGHLGCAKHPCRRAFIRYTAAIKEAEADKDGIAIEGVFDLDCVAPQTAKRGVKNPITIRATCSHTQCILLDLREEFLFLLHHSAKRLFIVGIFYGFRLTQVHDRHLLQFPHILNGAALGSSSSQERS
jgi:hypothetical protein